MAAIDLKHTTIEVHDGGTNYIEVVIGTGTFTYSERRNMEYRRNKGLLDTVREGDEEPMEVRFDFEWERLVGFGADNLEDALSQTDTASAWETSSADACEPYAVDIILNYNPDCVEAAVEVDDTMTFPDFRWETLDHDLSNGQISSSGQCNAKRAINGGTLRGS